MITQKELEEKRLELEKLKTDFNQTKEFEKLDKEIKAMQLEVKRSEFRKEHPLLLKTTSKIENGTKKFFSTLFGGIAKIPSALAKSDEFIREQKAKEYKSQQIKDSNRSSIIQKSADPQTHKKIKDDFDEAINGIK